jgi:hypothetical protein
MSDNEKPSAAPGSTPEAVPEAVLETASGASKLSLETVLRESSFLLRLELKNGNKTSSVPSSKLAVGDKILFLKLKNLRDRFKEMYAPNDAMHLSIHYPDKLHSGDLRYSSVLTTSK